MDGITYYEDCLIGANNLLEQKLCGETWIQTQTNKAILFGLLLVVIIIVFVYIKKSK